MRIAVIGHIKGFGCGSYGYRLAEAFDKDHEVCRIPTQALASCNVEGYRRLYLTSELIGDVRNKIDYIVVTQSHILIRNDTKIPLILLKTERVDPHGTVQNPTHILKRLEVIHDLSNYKDIVFSTIDLNRYNPNREKELLLADMQWAGQKFEGYIDIMERAQHAIIFQRVHETDCTTTRVLEAMACKTIPIIFYHTNHLRKMYDMMGINDLNAYWVCTARSYNLAIKEYDLEMANRGYELVHKYFGTQVLANKIYSMMNHGKSK